jgi:hypothetical protein
LPQFANALQRPGRHSQHLEAEDNAGTALLYMRFEIVINLNGRKRTPALLRARSRIRPSNSNRVLIDQTCFGRSGGLAPISLPLFHGVRLLGSEQFSLSDMIVLLCYEDDEHAPPARRS